MLKKDAPKTPCIFRKFKNGDIIALFPTELGTNDPYGDCLSYMHIGQHGAASIFITRDTKLAKPAEYKALKQELERIGYNLRIIERMTYQHTQERVQKLNSMRKEA